MCECTTKNERTRQRAHVDEQTNERPTEQLTKARTNEQTCHTKVMPKSLPGRARDAPGTTPESEKSRKNRSEALLARSWVILGRSGRSWDALEALSDAPRTLPGRPRDDMGRSQRPWDVPKTPQRALGAGFSRDLGAKACRKARRAIFERFCLARVLSRDSADVHDTSVLVGPKHNRSMFAARERAHA